jgi:outer membrane protein OmpA-like peptidoglycan-associated protein
MKVLSLFSILFFFTNCLSFTEFSRHDGFWDWLKGKPGYELTKSLNNKCASDSEIIIGSRHPFFLHFRLPELLINPQGGLEYPERQSNLGKGCNTIAKGTGKESKRFDYLEAGLLELIAYRDWTAKDEDLMDKTGYTLIKPLSILGYAFYLIPRVIVYTWNDVFKTIAIPIAGVYYSINSKGETNKEDKKRDTEIISKTEISPELKNKFQPYIDAYKKEFEWRSSFTESDLYALNGIENTPGSIQSIKTKLGNKPAPTYKNYLYIRKLVGFEIEKKNFSQASKIWKEYKSFFPDKSEEIDEIISILEEKEAPIQTNNVGTSVNQGNSYNPALELNGKKLFFTSMNAKDGLGGEDVFEVTEESGKWTNRKNLTELNTTSHEAVIGISPDGTQILLFGNYPSSFGRGDLFYSELTEKGWSTVKNFDPPVNSSDFESDANWSPDGKALLFVSDRQDDFSNYIMKGQYFNAGYWGNTDIYIAFTLSNGKLSNPVNLGPMINTPGAERTPFLHSDGKTLYFSSNGFGGFGDLDLYKSVRLDDTWMNWSKPVHLGKALNTPFSDWGFIINPSGTKGYIAGKSLVKGENNIYEISPVPPRARPDNTVIAISGNVTNENGIAIESDIEWQDLETGTSIGKLQSKPGSGEFFITLPAGKSYAYFARKEGYLNQSDTIDIKSESKYSEKKIKIVLVSIKSAIQNKTEITLNNIIFSSDSDVLDSKSFAELNRLVEILNQSANLKIEVQGHTSTAVGRTEVFNLDLSNKRATSVLKYIISKGIDQNRIISKGYGSSKPLFPNTSEMNRKKNRRVSFVIVGN